MFKAHLFPSKTASVFTEVALRAESTGAAIAESYNWIADHGEAGFVAVVQGDTVVGRWEFSPNEVPHWVGRVHALQAKLHGGWRTISVWKDLDRASSRRPLLANMLGTPVRIESFDTEDEAWAS